MEVKAVSKYVRVSPRKARVVVDLIRGKQIENAREILAFSERAIAETVLKTLNSAVANAEHNNNLRADNLVVKTAFVDEGPTLKRIRPRAKGSASRINKRTSHITIIVAPREEA
ncbi:50S ribosomal protein L22 [Adlercreutzia murintestinalis]|uniref:50S ribosomal protein L22 n=1 Tax=Adlercreutzia murintestinalis TaxID=2941325 RepID=UPI00204204CD|nr:50S ribosomal protein L22 [Adlercreutzia murintestinalis]